MPVTAEVYAGTDWDGAVRASKSFTSSELLFFGPVDDIGEEFSFRATRASFTPDTSGPHELTLVQAGRARVRIDGELALDGITNPPRPGRDLYGLGSEEMTTTLVLSAGIPIDIEIDYTSLFSAVLRGVKLGLPRDRARRPDRRRGRRGRRVPTSRWSSSARTRNGSPRATTAL